ncbi:hypothetical protein Lser_V15G04341 [Lactuca serriola]
MAVMGLLLLAILHFTHTELHLGKSELALSRFSSCVMLITYGAYFFLLLEMQQNMQVPSFTIFAGYLFRSRDWLLNTNIYVCYSICVVVGWIMGRPLDLNFQLFETATLIMTVLVVAFMLQDGTSNYFKGVILVFCYLIVAASPKKLEWDWTIVLPDLLLSMDVVVFGNGTVDVVVVVVIVVVPQSTKSKP